MSSTPPFSPEELALARVVGAAALFVLLADLGLLAVCAIGWIRGRSLLARRWSAAHVLIAFQAWLAPTLLGALLGDLAAVLAGGGWTNGAILAALVVQNAAMVGVVLFAVLKLYDQLPVAAGFSLRQWRPRVVIGLLAAVAVIPANVLLERLSLLALRHAPLTHATSFVSLVQRAVQKEYGQLLGLFSGPAGLAAAILLIGLIGPFGEEVFFRGFAYRCFRARWGPAAAMIASAALFSLVHFHPLGLIPIFMVGCVLAYLYERTGTLVAPFTLHAVNNIVAVLAATFGHRH